MLALLLLGASWQPQGLRVQWNEPEPVCLYLAGGGLPTWRYADVPCAATGDVVLGRGGVDYLLSPVGRERVELRAQSDLGRVVSSQAIERECVRCVVILPLIAAP